MKEDPEIRRVTKRVLDYLYSINKTMITVERALGMEFSDGFKERLKTYPHWWCLGLDQDNKIWIFEPPADTNHITMNEALGLMGDSITDDKPTGPFTLEKRKVWEHGTRGLGDHCPRKEKPVYTAPDKIPDTCRNDKCLNREWLSRGNVIRIKDTKQIVHRESDKKQ